MKKEDLNEQLEEKDSKFDLDGEMDELSDFYDEDYYEDEYDDDDIIDFSPKPESSRGAVTSLVLGVVATIGWIVPIIGLPITIVGIVLGAMNLKSRKAKGAAISGFVINIVFLLVSIAKGVLDIIKFFKKK